VRWKRLRRPLLLALLAGAVAWWYTHGRPSFQQMVDGVTNPLMGSKAAVKESEHNRVEGEAIAVVSEQTEAAVDTLKEGMSMRQVREVLGEPNVNEVVSHEKGKAEVVRWTYKGARRVLLFADGRLTSITVR
jgi:SmpA/OmlA family protein